MSDNIGSLKLILNQGLNDFKLMNKLRNNFKLAAIVLLNGFFTVGLFLIIGNLFAIVKINKIKQERDHNYYFRPHEKYTVADSFGKFNATYQKNINSLEITKYGDICHFANYKEVGSCYFSEGARTNRFITDKYGYKTLGNLSKAKVVLIGDSFLAGMGGEKMEEQLGWRIKNITGIDTYEAAHPGNPLHYIHRLEKIKKISKSDKKFLILLFEGNDFSRYEEYIKSKPWHYLRPIYVPILKQIFNTPLGKLYASYAEKKFPKYDLPEYTIKEVSGRKQAFSNYFINASNSNLKFFPMNKFLSLKNDLCSVVFIPTASSVYLNQKSFETRHPMLKKQFDQLNNSGFQIINLTKDFKSFTKENPNIPLWWSDDTHWNKNGINLAAKVISKKSNCFK